MGYKAFERIVVIGVACALMASVGISAYLGSLSVVGLTIQLLVAFVALTTTKYGRRGGSGSALVASVIYVLVQGQAASASLIATPSPLTMLWPIGAFGIVGIAGGQLLTLLKYDRSRFIAADALDEYSRLYNQRHFAELLADAKARFQESGCSCCVVILRVSYELAEERAARHRAIVRSIAQQIISGVRLVDDCARLDDGSFALLLWGCGARQGHGVADRLSSVIRRQLKAANGRATSSVTALPDDASGFDRLVASWTQETDYPVASGA